MGRPGRRPVVTTSLSIHSDLSQLGNKETLISTGGLPTRLPPAGSYTTTQLEITCRVNCRFLASRVFVPPVIPRTETASAVVSNPEKL